MAQSTFFLRKLSLKLFSSIMFTNFRCRSGKRCCILGCICLWIRSWLIQSLKYRVLFNKNSIALFGNFLGLISVFQHDRPLIMHISCLNSLTRLKATNLTFIVYLTTIVHTCSIVANDSIWMHHLWKVLIWGGRHFWCIFCCQQTEGRMSKMGNLLTFLWQICLLVVPVCRIVCLWDETSASFLTLSANHKCAFLLWTTTRILLTFLFIFFALSFHLFISLLSRIYELFPRN